MLGHEGILPEFLVASPLDDGLLVRVPRVCVVAPYASAELLVGTRAVGGQYLREGVVVAEEPCLSRHHVLLRAGVKHLRGGVRPTVRSLAALLIADYISHLGEMSGSHCMSYSRYVKANDQYDLYDLYDLAHVAGWDPYNLHDLPIDST